MVQIQAPTKPGKKTLRVSGVIGRTALVQEHTFDGLLRAQLDELSPAERNAANIGEDVIGDDQRDRDEKPDHALEDIIHNEMRLHDDQVERHVCPRELSELEAVVTFLEGSDEEDKAWIYPSVV